MPTDADHASRDELRELAALEVVGCLDEVDAARLERMFEAARPSVQAEIRSLQASLATDPALRSSDTAPADLRLRVLARIATEIEAAERAQAPLASIGPAKGARPASVAGDGIEEVLERVEAVRRSMDGERGGWWSRAAIFFLLASLAVSLFFNWRYTRLSEKVLGFANSSIIDADMRAAVASMGAFDFAASRHIDLRPAVAGVRGHVHAFADADGGRVVVLGVGLAPGETLEIVISGEEGVAPVTQVLRVDATAFGAMLEVAASVASNPRIEIRDAWGTLLFSV